MCLAPNIARSHVRYAPENLGPGKDPSGVLKAYASYYNEVRTHLSLDKDAPDFRRAQRFGRIAAIPILGGIHHQYVRV